MHDTEVSGLSRVRRAIPHTECSTGARFSPRAAPFKSNVVINELHLGRPWLEFGAAK